jgi:soluble lytic murein transglycosylase-like protein
MAANLPPDPFGATAATIDGVRNLIVATSGRHTLSPALLYAMIHVSSSGNPDYFSVEGTENDARFGLTGLLRRQVRALAFEGPVRMLFDPSTNLELAAQILTALFRERPDQRDVLAVFRGGAGVIGVRLPNRWQTRAWVWVKQVQLMEPYYDRREKARTAAV